MSVHITVHAGNGEQAIRNLKREMQKELVLRSLKNACFYEPPSVKRVREKQETERRIRKQNRRRRLEW